MVSETHGHTNIKITFSLAQIKHLAIPDRGKLRVEMPL